MDGLAEALASFPTGVTLVMVADGRDDIGTTVSAFCPVSQSPPLVLVSLIADSYPAEVLGRVDRFAVTMLAAGQRALAGRFAAAGPAPGCCWRAPRTSVAPPRVPSSPTAEWRRWSAKRSSVSRPATTCWSSPRCCGSPTWPNPAIR